MEKVQKGKMVMETKSPSSQEISAMTPMLRQYFGLKEQCKQCILFFRMGDFYELFGSDAELIAPVLNIVLTSRERGDKNKIPFCGVPHHSAASYWHKLLKKGYRIAIADQVEDAAVAKGLVKRAIVKTLSPGCIDELEGLDATSPNYMMAIYEDPQLRSWAVLISDVSTGELRLSSAKDLSAVIKLVQFFSPKELLLRKFQEKIVQAEFSKVYISTPPIISHLNESLLRDDTKQQQLIKDIIIDKSSLRKIQETTGGSQIISLFFLHLSLFKVYSGHYKKVLDLYEDDHMILDETVIRNLELFESNLNRDKKTSLFNVINLSQTPMGSRKIRQSMLQPLCCSQKISQRHDDVEFFITLGRDQLHYIRSLLKSICDIERLAIRIASLKASPLELAKVRQSLIQVTKLTQIESIKNKKASKSLVTKLNSLSCCNSILDKLKNLLDQPSSLGRGSEVFISTCDSELNSYLNKTQYGDAQIESYQKKLREKTSIHSLKIKRHKTYGLLIEVTKANVSKIADNFIRRQTMVNCERFVTEELKELDESISSALDRAIGREAQLFELLLTSLSHHVDELRHLAQSLAYLDMIISYSWLALERSYVRPKLNKHKEIFLKASRHPVVECFLSKDNFIANDIYLSAKAKTMVITGPNMAGKSTVMRQSALSAIISQMGCFVPAEEASLPVFDNIYTRIGASDNLAHGLSTFMVEMQEAAHVLKSATAKSLVILDEIGRGTSTEDGLAIASAILKNISEEITSWTFFATHYHELLALFAKNSQIIPFQVQVIQKYKEIYLTHKLIKGVCSRSFGVEVAKRAGVCTKIIEDAQIFLESRAVSTQSLKLPIKAEQEFYLNNISKQQENFTAEKKEEILKKLENMDINRMTPIKALNVLSELISSLEKKSKKKVFRDGLLLF
jgi:DNA mismatch repair protein MutS